MSSVTDPQTFLPAKCNITLVQDATYRKRYAVRRDGALLDLTGATIDADIYDTSTDALIESFTPDLITGEVGQFFLEMTSAETRALTAGSGYRWDLAITEASGDRFYYVEGNLTVQATVSREDYP